MTDVVSIPVPARAVSTPPAPNYLKQWREYAGLTQAQVEKLNGWPGSRVSNLENGRAKITPSVLLELAKHYSCLPAQLLEPPPRETRVLAKASERSGALVEALNWLAELANQLLDLSGQLDAAHNRIEAIQKQVHQTYAFVETAAQHSAARQLLFEQFLVKVQETEAAVIARPRPREDS